MLINLAPCSLTGVYVFMYPLSFTTSYWMLNIHITQIVLSDTTLHFKMVILLIVGDVTAMKCSMCTALHITSISNDFEV